MDEEYSDRENIALIYFNTENDQISGDIDFGCLRITNEINYLLIRIKKR